MSVRVAKKIFLKTLAGLRVGGLELVCPEATYQFGDLSDPLRAVVAVHDDQFFRHALLAGDIGIGEAYMQGDWSTPDLVAVVRLAVRNMAFLDGSNRLFTAFRRIADWFEHRGRGNTQSGSRRNIAYHYDLGNDFYRLFLDKNMVYSSAYYESAQDSLERAQVRKFDRICQKLRLGREDHVLEIGTGWGGFAAHAAENTDAALRPPPSAGSSMTMPLSCSGGSMPGAALNFCLRTTGTWPDSMTRSSALRCSKRLGMSITTNSLAPATGC